VEAIARVLLAQRDLRAGRPAQASAALGTVADGGVEPRAAGSGALLAGRRRGATAGAGRADRQEAQRMVRRSGNSVFQPSFANVICYGRNCRHERSAETVG
jgi:hypothetical protein